MAIDGECSSVMRDTCLNFAGAKGAEGGGANINNPSRNVAIIRSAPTSGSVSTRDAHGYRSAPDVGTASGGSGAADAGGECGDRCRNVVIPVYLARVASAAA